VNLLASRKLVFFEGKTGNSPAIEKQAIFPRVPSTFQVYMYIVHLLQPKLQY
jgi:hypothetical protein